MSYTVNGTLENNVMTVSLGGRVDSSNSSETEEAIRALLTPEVQDVILDIEDLEYISSAGLRVVLRLRKDYPTLKVVNASSEVYEIFDMTGFTEMLPVEKAYRKLSVDGCEVIGEGSNGVVYRIDRDTIIKVYRNPDALPEIHKERELARKAFVMGVPTAIPYDVVKVGESYGSVFELLNATSFSKIIAAEPDKLDQVIDWSVELLKTIHSVELEPGEMPDMKAVAVDWAHYLEGHLPEEIYQKLVSLVEAVPENHHMMHGDYHTKNIMLQNGEVLLIDMDTLCLGDPVFEFGSIYNAYVGFSELDHNVSQNFLGIPHEAAETIWDQTVRRYFGTEDEAEVEAIKEKAMVIGQTRLLRRTLRRLADTEEGRKQIECSRNHLLELVPKIDSLTLA